MSIFVFDIETVPDVKNLRKIIGLDDSISDKDVVEAAVALRQQEGKSSFLPHYLQRIVAISCVLRSQDKIAVWSLGEPDSPEPDLIKRFFSGVEKYVPTLVSWNGGGFDLPVLHHRALIHGVSAPQYWEMGDNNRDFRYNNYVSRYHSRHTDLMDLLAAYQPRANAPLDHIAGMLGFPGKMGMGGDKVWDAYQNDEINAIRDYCETDVLNTYLVYLAFEKMRGNADDKHIEHEHTTLREYLKQENKPHFNQFLQGWAD